MARINHYLHLLPMTEEPEPPPGSMAGNDRALDHEAA